MEISPKIAFAVLVSILERGFAQYCSYENVKRTAGSQLSKSQFNVENANSVGSCGQKYILVHTMKHGFPCLNVGARAIFGVALTLCVGFREKIELDCSTWIFQLPISEMDP